MPAIPSGSRQLLVRRARKAIQAIVDPRVRCEVMARVWPAPTAHQPSTYTRRDRYPHVFSAAEELLHHRSADGAPLRLLSVGCATGEETATLRRYFPTATIVGSDVNPRALTIARRSTRDPGITFCLADEVTGSFDAIFCLTVLQHSRLRKPGLSNARVVYPFERFESELQRLDSFLAPDGLLILDGLDYCFSDSSLASDYVPVSSSADGPRPWPRYDRDGQRRSILLAADPIVFRKLRDARAERTTRVVVSTARDSAASRAARFAEALALLTAAQIAVDRVPFARLSKLLGLHPSESATTPADGQAVVAYRIGASIELAASWSPFGPVCLPQAIAGKLMLARRRIPATLYLGVRRGGDDSLDAHAWLRVGDSIVTGADEVETFAQLASFA